MSTFDNCMEFVFNEEGGYVNDPADPGGETKYGISKRAYPQLDIANLTKDEASAIYHRDYWTPAHCDVLEPSVALYMFDMAVNMGIVTATRIVQRAAGVPDDGVFGPVTLANVADAQQAALVSSIHLAREAYYRSLNNFARYGKGWLARNDRCLTRALMWLQP